MIDFLEDVASGRSFADRVLASLILATVLIIVVRLA